MFSSILYNKIYSRLHLRLFPKNLLFELTCHFHNRPFFFFFFICRMWTHTAKIQRDSSRLKAVSSCAMSCWLLRHGEEWGWRWRESGTPALLKGHWKREQRELPTESNFTEQYELLTPEPPLHTHHITFMVSVFEKLAYLVLEFCS